MNGKRHTAERSRGSILMETLICIPLYIAFLSGIFLLGDLGIGHSRLTAGDRFAVWLSGCRHDEKNDETVKKETSGAFFPEKEFARGTGIKSFQSRKTPVSWYAVVRGGAELKINLPVWAVQTRKGALRLFADIGEKPEETLWDNVSFKAREIEEKDTHTLLMRRDYDTRQKSARELAQGAPLWFTEYRTAYIDKKGTPNDRPGSLTVCTGTEYTRFSQFVTWSR